MKRGMLVLAVLAVVAAMFLAPTPALACGHYEGVSAASSLNSMFSDLAGFSATAVWQDSTHAMSFRVTAPDGSTTTINAHGNSNWLNDAISFLQDHVSDVTEPDVQDDYAG